MMCIIAISALLPSFLSRLKLCFYSFTSVSFFLLCTISIFLFFLTNHNNFTVVCVPVVFPLFVSYIFLYK